MVQQYTPNTLNSNLEGPYSRAVGLRVYGLGQGMRF